MRFFYSRHALERMQQRGVGRRQVEEALCNPDWSEKTKQGRSMNIKRYGKREVEVIYKSGRGKYYIITVRAWVK